MFKKIQAQPIGMPKIEVSVEDILDTYTNLIAKWGEITGGLDAMRCVVGADRLFRSYLPSKKVDLEAILSQQMKTTVRLKGAPIPPQDFVLNNTLDKSEFTSALVPTEAYGVPFMAYGFPIKVRGTLIGMIGITVDLSDKQDLENLINTSVKELNSAVANVSDTIRNNKEIQNQFKLIINQVNQKIGVLIESLKKIDNIQKTLIDISEKVNVIRINLSIEATRVGATANGIKVVSAEIAKENENIAGLSKNIETEIQGITTLVSTLKDFSKTISEKMEALSNSDLVVASMLDELNAQVNNLEKIASKYLAKEQ
jgi:hypothetical protein